MPTEVEMLRAEIAALRVGLRGPRVPTAEEKVEIDTFFTKKIAPLNSVCMLPDGKFYTREELMVKLGLDPTTPPEAWICGAGCGSNMAGLPRGMGGGPR